MWRAMAALALIGLGPAAAASAPPPAMTFQLVRAASPQCAPDCPEWIAAEGRIAQGTAQTFRAFLARLDGRRRPVLIQSNGGSVDDALEIGRLIRARGLAVAVARTSLTAYTPGEPTRPAEGSAVAYPAYCYSACSFVPAGGVERYVNPLASVGVHQTVLRSSEIVVTRGFRIRYRVVNGRRREVSREVTSENRKAVAFTQISPPAVNARLVAHFREMGEDPEIVALMQTATPEHIHEMSPGELIATRLATIWVGQSSAFNLQRGDSGLAGASAQPGAADCAALRAEQTFALPAAADGEARKLNLRLSRRGAGEVTATMSPAGGPSLRFGLAPETLVRAVYPAADFCRFADVGVLFAAEGRAPPTHAPGLPDARAPLLSIPLARVDGVGRLREELCPAATASR